MAKKKSNNKKRAQPTYDNLINLAEKAFNSNNLSKAISKFKKALQLHPDDASLHNNLGVIYFKQGSYEKAKDCFKKAVQFDNLYFDPLYNLAKVCIKLDQDGEASQYLQKCLRHQPDDKKVKQLASDVQLKRDSVPLLTPGANQKTDTPLNILFVQEAPCIRNYKMAKALRSRGNRVSLAYTKVRLSQMYKGLSDDVYNECIKLENHRQLWDISKNYDILHCHNEPDVLTVAALAGDTPVVHDTHDLLTLRHGKNRDLQYFEGLANRGASGRVYVSDYQKDMAHKIHGTDLDYSIVLHNYVSKSMIPDTFLPKRSQTEGGVHVVYEGGVTGPELPHRYFLPLFQTIAQHHYHLHIYAPFHQPHYEAVAIDNPYLHYYPPMSPEKIVRELSQYDVGLIPFIVNDENRHHLDSAMPNKLFEYLAAGLPVLAKKLYSLRVFFERYPVGVLYDDVNDIFSGIDKIRSKIPKAAPYVFENNIQTLEDLYIRLLHKKTITTISNDESNACQQISAEKYKNSKAMQTASNYGDWLQQMIKRGVHFLTASQVIEGENIRRDRPNALIRHDIDFSPTIGLKMAEMEEKVGARTTFYVFHPDRYDPVFPLKSFQRLESEGWEIGYHTSTEDLDEALHDIDQLRQYFRIRTTVPHMGNIEICRGKLKEHIDVLRDGHCFLVQDDGYIADNRGFLRQRIQVDEKGENEWKDIDGHRLLAFIDSMEDGKVYHFLFHPVWYDEKLNFRGNDQKSDKKIILKAPVSEGRRRTGQVHDKPAIFIGGTGRSGTTILRDILGTHSQIASIPYETKLTDHASFFEFPQAFIQSPPEERKKILEVFKQRWLTDYYRFSATWDTRTDDDKLRGLHKWITQEDIRSFLHIWDDLAISSNEEDVFTAYGRYIDALFSHYATQQGKKFWLEKTTANSIVSPFWYSCFPNLRLINIIRDGRDVACSLIKMPWGADNIKDGLDWWANSVKEALQIQKILPRDVYLNIRYEDLVLKKQSTLEAIYRFIKVPWDDAPMSVEVFKKSVGRYHKEMSEEMKQYAAKKYGALLVSLEYEVEG